MLTNKQIIKIVNNSFYNYSIKKELQPTKKKETCPFFFPHYQDTLFWCFYIINYNKTEYELISKSGFKEEKAFKISFLENVNQNKSLLKTHKIKYTILHNELMNSKNIDLITFKCLCVFNKLNAIIIKDKLYYEFLYGNDKPIQVIHFKNNKYGLEEFVTQEKVNFYRLNLLKIDETKKKLLSMSYYKMTNILEMCKKLDIPVYNEKQKHRLKKDLYADLQVQLM